MNFLHTYPYLAILATVWASACTSYKTAILPTGEATTSAYKINEREAVHRLSLAIQHRTISYEDTTEINYENYENFIEFLEVNYPVFHCNTIRKYIGGYSLLYKWEGSRSDLKPVLLIGHYDVVPVKANNDSSWQKPPFKGIVEGQFIWGRGALDDKSGVMSMMEAVEYLSKQGFQPQRTIYIAIHHDEEVGGERGAKRVADYMRLKGIALEYLLDEGLPIAEGIIKNIKTPLAMIGVAEKGSVNIELIYRQDGGHSSMPSRNTVISTLSRAVNRIDQRPMKAYYGGIVEEMFEPLIPHMTYIQQLVFNNPWLFRGLIKRKLSKNPITNAALRTTAAKTIFEAGFKENILPIKGRVIINFRVHPNDTVDDVIEYVHSRIGNRDIEIHVSDRARNPSPVSDTNAQPFKMLRKTILESFDQMLVSPALFIAASDSRHFLDLTPNVYRFRPIRAKQDDRFRVHGIDERISIDNYLEMIRFYIHFIENGSLQTYN